MSLYFYVFCIHSFVFLKKNKGKNTIGDEEFVFTGNKDNFGDVKKMWIN